MENLDLKCAELGERLAGQQKVDEKLLNNALAVLEEQGVYAFFLYLKTRGGDGGESATRTCAEFLQGVPAGRPILGRGDVFQALQALGQDLDRLLFARDLLRQALLYGRYHAKARGARGGSA